MIIEKSKELLRKLRRSNCTQLPDFGMDEESEMIIRVISNECKATILSSDQNKKIRGIRCGSSIVKENVYQIVRQLILNGGIIQKEVMNNLIYSNGTRIGINADIQLYKGIRKNEDGTIERTATTGDFTIDVSKLGNDTLGAIRKEVYERFARQFILINAQKLPPTNKISLFKEKILHRREDKEFIRKQFVDILKNTTAYSSTIIKNTVNYHLDYMYNDNFKKKLLETANFDTTVIPIESKGKSISFKNLLKAISIETEEIENAIPNINEIRNDIQQIYADVEAQLIAYSIDITKLNENQIEEKIKQINKTSLIDPEHKKHIEETGYRDTDIIIGKDGYVVDFKKVEPGMKRLVTDIYELVQNSSLMDNEEYLKRAVQLDYRFIRIHPFPDSNGRTSRALLNMMTIPKGILVNFSKDKKQEFTKTSNQNHQLMDQKEYLQAIEENSGKLTDMEINTEMPLYEFVKKNCIIEIKNVRQGKENEMIKENSEEKIH